MTEGVTKQDVAKPDDKAVVNSGLSDKEINFRKVEALREQEREARIKAELQNDLLRNELESIKQMLQPKEKDYLDDLQDISDLDPAKFKAILAQKEAQFKKEAKQIAKSAIDEHEQQKRKTNFRDELRRQYHDYDSVMNEQMIAHISETEPDALGAISAIEDPYVRCEKAYHFFKKKMPTQKQELPSIKEKVEENAMNPYMIAASSAAPPYAAVEFDVRSSSARKDAYEKLKAAQRRPLR